MSLYTDNGYKNRDDYLRCMSEDYAVPLDVVVMLAQLLGENEDFDGLVTSLVERRRLVMAHVLKDSMNHYAIEIKRGPKYVQCIVRLAGEVEYKSYPITKMITDHEHNTNDGTYQFDRRWQPCSPEQDAGCTLERVIESFLTGMLPVTDKARRMLEALRDNPGATAPLPDLTQPTEEGAATMSTKKAKAPKEKKEKKEKKTKAEKGYKGHRAGSRKEAMHWYMDDKKPERAEFIAQAVEKHGLAAGTASSWYQSFKK